MTHQGCCSSRVGAALDNDVDPALAASWITEAQRERRGLGAQLGQQIPGEQLSSSQVKALVHALRDTLGALAAADPSDKADLCRELSVTLRYDPSGSVTVQAQPRGVTLRVGGSRGPENRPVLRGELGAGGVGVTRRRGTGGGLADNLARCR